MDALPWSRHYRCFPGQGGFDLTGFMADVLAAGYQGPWSLEVFNDVFRQADAERTARDGMRSLLTLEDALAHPDPTGAAADPAPPVRLARLPAAASLRGYAFVELAVDGLLGQATERVLRSLGFQPARQASHQAGRAVAAGRRAGAGQPGRAARRVPGARGGRRGRPGRGERRPGPVGPPGPRAAGPGHPPPLRAGRGRPHRGRRAGRDRGLLLPGRGSGRAGLAGRLRVTAAASRPGRR